MTIASISLANTVDEWRTVTNQLVVRANDIDEGNLIRFQSNTNAIFISANAVRGNIIYLSANVTDDLDDSSTLNIASASLSYKLNQNVITLSSTLNSSFGKLNVVYTQANTARVHANVAYEKANTANITADAAFDQANQAYAVANVGNVVPVFSKLNVAFNVSNVAFNRANTANITADAAFGAGNIISAVANASFNRANTANINAKAAFDSANIIASIANSAWDKANTANITADAAFGASNTSHSRLNLAFNIANTANITADSAFGAGNAIHARVNIAFSRANTANITADAAFGAVNVAHVTANSAWANGANAVIYTRGSPAVVDSNVVIFSGTTGRLIKDGNKTLPSGSVVGTTDTQTLTNKTITGIRETRVAVAASAIDLSLGNYFTKTATGALTWTATNVPAAGNAASFILDLTNGGTGTQTFFSGIKWAGGSAPTLTVSGRDILGFFTHDGGTTWNGVLIGLDFK